MAFDWVVIGAGPAGIAAVGKLLDQGIAPGAIGWIDPFFLVGDLGRKWRHVPSNTHVELFLRFLRSCQSFEYDQCPIDFPINQIDPHKTCYLREISEPLQWVTEKLQKEAVCFHGTAIGLNLREEAWHIDLEKERVVGRNVILAIGSEPKSLAYSYPDAIPLEIALDREALALQVRSDQRVGVFGSSHSAILVLANLVELGVKEVINFYRSPHKYALYLDDWILFDDTGLKGFAAEWARKHLDGGSASLTRIVTSDYAFEEGLSRCDHLVYAVGFERRKIPVLEQYTTLEYHETTGIIAPGLFGVGLAFPQAHFDRLMNLEYRVGLWKFADYLDTILPLWLQYGNKPRG